VRALDTIGNVPSGSIPLDHKMLPRAALGQTRQVEFLFPADATVIEAGAWLFTIEIPPNWSTRCETQLASKGLNTLEAMEGQQPCTGDFVTFNGEHEVGIDDVLIDPRDVRVGARPTVKFSATNSGEKDETFNVNITMKDAYGVRKGNWTREVRDLASGDTRILPIPGDLPITWDTTGLAAGDYSLQANISPTVMGDVSPDNDHRSTIVILGFGDSDSDGINDDLDNCPRTPNPSQENCDSRPAGDACDTPQIRAFDPKCNLAGGEDVTVIGFGFANIQPSDITIGTKTAASIVSQSACQIVFRNPADNSDPIGMLKIATTPPVEAPLCCSAPNIEAFTPTQGQSGTLVTVLGCGFQDADVILEKAGVQSPRITPEVGSGDNALLFKVPPSVIKGSLYSVRLVRTAPALDIIAADKFLVLQ
jgi:hypothetical protein